MAKRELGWLMLCGVALCGVAAQAADTSAVSLINNYARRFDNAYLAAAKGKRAPAGAPYDSEAADPAQQIHDSAQVACDQAPVTTAHARMECYLAADQAFADAAKLKDTILVATFAAAIRQAADDADAGKLTPEQLGNVYFRVGETYNAIIHDQFSKWRKAHPAPN